jgi:hypothetical protein
MPADLAVALEEALAGTTARPLPFSRVFKGWETSRDRKFPVSKAGLAKALLAESPADPVRWVLRTRLSHWDHAPTDGEWTNGTEPNSDERRQRIYDLLEPGDALLAALEATLAPVITDQSTVVIERGGYENWYTPERRAGRTFYWDNYAEYLHQIRRWPPENIAALDGATREIVQRLADPSRQTPRQTKGLVVGHVQSGKTANFTGVIAKAADAGYRLVIVLSGLTNLLRDQTQRRIDRELIGQEIIRPAGVDPEDEELDYRSDPDWASFIQHGGTPSELGAFDWVRLTGEHWDYRRLKAGISSLEFERHVPAKPFYAPENLDPAYAKIMVIKKHAGRIENIFKDLKRIRARSRLADVPVLIIDDESDQASVNTAKPTLDPAERDKRSRINERIVDLLELLPRSQYIGYTATPFANVLIDATDEADVFPRDFIVSLFVPPQYLGARDFHDLDGPPVGIDSDPYVSNERCFVRNISGDDDREQNLPAAIDAFVLSGALKLWRQNTRKDGDFKHHTMLVHSSQYTADHAHLSSVCSKIFADNGYETAEAARRLQALWKSDFLPVSRARGNDGCQPKRWSELKPFVGQAVSRIRGGDAPVIQVNGTDQGADPDFDMQPVWKILIGGAKLSRGYTIEGLTVSYFRRRATAGDALMQMGRWFGYRTGYRDLVRLFISREEGTRPRTYDLYEGFEATCRDEELFRAQLRRYALDNPDAQPIRPIDIPPLVYSHLEWLPPVPKNKRLNARVEFENLGGEWREPTMAPTETDRITENAELFGGLLDGAEFRKSELRVDLEKLVNGTPSVERQSFSALSTLLEPAEVVRALRGYRWASNYESGQLERILEFLRGTKGRDPQISSWMLLAPQLRGRGQTEPWTAGGAQFKVKRRARVSPDGIRVKAYSEPAHRIAAEEIAGAREATADSEITSLVEPHRAVMLFYPTHHLFADEDPPPDFVPTMGFALFFPNNDMPQRVTLVTRRAGDDAFVDAAPSEDDD